MSVNLNNLDVREQLVSIDMMARSTSGTPAGNIGMLGGRVVKFNTHWTERLFSSTTKEMIDASNEMRSVLNKAIVSLYPYNVERQLTLLKMLGSHKTLLERSVVAKVIQEIRNDEKVGELALDLDSLAALSSKGRKTDFATVQKAVQEDNRLFDNSVSASGGRVNDRVSVNDSVVTKDTVDGDEEDRVSVNDSVVTKDTVDGDEKDRVSVNDSVIEDDFVDEEEEEGLNLPQIALKTDYAVGKLGGQTGGSADLPKIVAEIGTYIVENHPQDSRCAVTRALNLYSEKSETLAQAAPEDQKCYLKFLKAMVSKINRAPVTSMAADGMLLVSRLAPNKTLNVGSSSMCQNIGTELYKLLEFVGTKILSDRTQTIKSPTFNNPVQLPEIGKLGESAEIKVPNVEYPQERLTNGYTLDGKAIPDFGREKPDTEMTWPKLLGLQLLRDGVGTGHSFNDFLQGFATALNKYSKESLNLKLAPESNGKTQKSDYLKFLQMVRVIVQRFATMSDDEKSEYASGAKNEGGKPLGVTLKQDFLQEIRKELDSRQGAGKIGENVYKDLSGWLDVVAGYLDSVGEFYREARY